MLELTAIAFSPWSEKARWALDHHGCDYHEVPYAPVLGEWRLRWRLRRPVGRITVPVLRDGDRWLTDSLDIARHADSIGRGPTLFPERALAEILEWNRRSEAALAAGRAILMRTWARTPELAVAALPADLPQALRPLALSLGRRRLRGFMAKYGIQEDDPAPDRVLRDALETLERTLEGRLHLIGDRFTYADIAMALTLQQVRPVDPRHIPRLPGLPPAGMNVPELETRHARLFAWRDALYDRFRRTSVPV
ncbi:MAG: glutathione S-transferase family protein [Myxococcota bacterium]